jgi:hypothetical protein
MRRTTLALVFCVVISPARAGFYTGTELADQCNRKTEFCDAYIMGAADYLFTQMIINGWNLFCPPETANLTLLAEAVKGYIAAKPDQWHWPATGLVHDGLVFSFPCP